MTAGTETTKGDQVPVVEALDKYHVFVYYINNPKDGDIDKVNEMVRDSKIFENIDGVFLIVPTIGDNRIECILPKYITNEELIKKNNLLLEELHEHIKYKLDNGL